MALRNVLYLAVLPIVRLPNRSPLAFLDRVNKFGKFGSQGFGIEPADEPVEQVCTLFAIRELATEFFEDEVQTYVSDFLAIANKHLRGGHVIGYEHEIERTDDGRFVVRVIQNVK
jgi:hypothetical protein